MEKDLTDRGTVRMSPHMERYEESNLSISCVFSTDNHTGRLVRHNVPFTRSSRLLELDILCYFDSGKFEAHLGSRANQLI